MAQCASTLHSCGTVKLIFLLLSHWSNASLKEVFWFLFFLHGVLRLFSRFKSIGVEIISKVTNDSKCQQGNCWIESENNLCCLQHLPLPNS